MVDEDEYRGLEAAPIGGGQGLPVWKVALELIRFRPGLFAVNLASMLAMMGGAGTGEVSSKMLEIHGELSSLGFLWDVHG